MLLFDCHRSSREYRRWVEPKIGFAIMAETDSNLRGFWFGFVDVELEIAIGEDLLVEADLFRC
jgi:hypothetical protein